MATVRMMQGDSYAIFVDLKADGSALTPDKVSDIEITVGDSFRKLYSSGEVGYDATMLQWYFLPTQEDTLAMEPNAYEVQIRVKFPNGQYSAVKGVSVGRIIILDAQSEEVI
jgi:hypothetical protein